MTFKLMTDSCCDLPYTYLEANDVDFISMTIQLNGKELIDDLGKTFDYDWFLHEIKTGGMPTTSQVNVGSYIEFFRPWVETKTPILYLAFSSGLSGSYQSAIQAVEILKEEYGDAEIYVIDTKAASLGEGLLVSEVIQLKEAGHSLDEILLWLSENKMTVQSWVTVDDLKHLERGGRISKTAAAIGGLMNVKPIIIVDEQGKLKNIGKVRGRGKALKKLSDETVQGMVEPLKQTIFIAYAGDLESAEKVKALIEEKIQVKEIRLHPLGPTITSHTGNGCIAVFSRGKKR
ncbi:fatty acid-binding protein DegV [Enterococcus silesiacus]|uniref:DegV family EDD domain-containing protein n=1 Tax=Enterococcus silesiacus TaxID=332949 RepID=A0A0S3KDS5_9ENTE|nr:DegV family protein [Enterococcus silesiacus]ALS02356.1 fatty acid-binding protein DegV [Enterococcus silesiacus]OJG91329.1 DegV family EDD domain-containing protein [Enterococcus silesiacus]